MIRAVAKLIVSYGDSLNEEVFKEKLGCRSIREISRIAKDHKIGSMGYAEAMVTIYNQGFKNEANKLDWGCLYSSRKRKSYVDAPIDNSEDSSD